VPPSVVVHTVFDSICFVVSPAHVGFPSIQYNYQKHPMSQALMAVAMRRRRKNVMVMVEVEVSTSIVHNKRRSCRSVVLLLLS